MAISISAVWLLLLALSVNAHSDYADIPLEKRQIPVPFHSKQAMDNVE